ncbi:thyroid hormone receptor-associated protein 3 isoform X5 [Conger conger]|uniref:thyroid hormone receptor-associated protein 3 isoform X5 n=1 Tax=Conger conger TaxID=82655 RepID=UPI002A59E4EA|nr:thyroid hormone receptor-associated protein 3 isoform X5 [Conger conger]
MKKRTGSRSRSRSRSHSPAHNRDRDYPREYQNNRQFRGYHRGFRRPYYYRGRGRGYFPRGRYQRGGGGGGYNNNYRPNNWQNYRQHPQQQQPPPPPHHPHSPRRGRSRSRTPKKRSGSPRSRSRSRYSDRSSSGRSRRSHRSSSSSSSRSSSPRRPRRQRRRSGSGSGSAKDREKEKGSSREKRGSVKDAKERSASKEAAARAGSGSRSGSATGGAEPDPEGGGAGGAPGEDGNAPERPGSGNWQGLTDYSASPKRASPQMRSAVVSVPGQPSPTPKSSGSSTNSAAPWHGGGTAPPAQSPKQKSPTAAFSGFGFFSKEDHRAGDKSAISAAFKKFLEEHKNKKQVAEWENGRDKEPGDAADGEPEKGPAFDRAPGYGAPKEKEKYSKYGAGFETGGGGAGGGGFLKAAPPFLCAEEEEEDEEVEKMAAARRPPKPRRDREAEPPQVKLSTRELFEERFGKWDDLAYFPSGKERPRKAPEGEGEEPDEAEEELYRARKQERAKKEALFRGFSPDKAPQKTRKKEPPGLSPSPPAPPRRGGGSSDARDRDTFLVQRDGSPVRASAKRGGDTAVRTESFRDDAASSSGVLVTERRLSRDLVHPSKKEQEFRSIFQHIENTQLCRSPSELFAQHIVNIVHQIKAQHFPSSGLTLNERFALYQRRAAEKEMAKPRKSPEIHRRIDVSPSAFKKHSHSHLFDDMKASGDGGYKEDRKRGMKGEAVDLRLDIERRKKYSGKEAEPRRELGRDSADSRGSSRERSGEKYSKHHKKSKKSKKKRERSRSSSASSSSSPSRRAGPGDFLHEDMEPKEEGGFNKARLGPREFGGPMERGRARGGFQFRIRGRGWNRGSYPGNNSNGNPPNMGPVPTHPKSEDWDPEYTPKSRKYYLVSFFWLFIFLYFSPPFRLGTKEKLRIRAHMTTERARATRSGWTTAGAGAATSCAGGAASSCARRRPPAAAPSGHTTSSRAAGRRAS